MSVDRAVAGGIGIAANVVAWAQAAADGNWTVGGVVTAVTAISAAISGAVVFGFRQIGPAYVDLRKQLDEANKASMAGQMATLNAQIADLQESVATGRKSVHDLRNEAQAREASHAEEVDRLMEQIKLLQEINAPLHKEVARLNSRVQELTSEVDRLNAQIAAQIASQVVEGDAAPHGGPAPQSSRGPAESPRDVAH